MPLPICQFAMHVLQATFALKNVMGERSSTLQTLKLKRRVDKRVINMCQKDRTAESP